MSGFGDSPFGGGYFGEWDWSFYTFVTGIPSVYQEQDESAGAGTLRALLEGIAPSMDGIRQKIREYDSLRDPLKVPIDMSFSTSVIILRVDNQGDGTSVVYLGNRTTSDTFDGLRPGMTITDKTGTKFSISSVAMSTLASDVLNPPTDPITGLPNGNHVIVENIGQGSLEIVPTASRSSTSWHPLIAGGAYIIDPTGSYAPYVFNSDVSLAADIPKTKIYLSWTEGGASKLGFFSIEGVPGGDLSSDSTIDYLLSAAPIGQFRIYNNSKQVIDTESINVRFSAEDAEVNAQNILGFLAADYGVKIDRNDPEYLQRSYVNSASKIWDIKGTAQGYYVLGQYAGYFVGAQPLYAISNSVALTLPGSYVYELPAGTPAIGSITAIAPSLIIDGQTFTLDDGVNVPKVFEFDVVPNGVTPGRVAVDISAAVTSIDVANAITFAINSLGGAFNLTATNSVGTSSLVTIKNGLNGSAGNVTTWFDTVSDPTFIVVQPTGGVDGDLFTTINPGRGLFDEIALDAIPLDELCSDSAYPSVTQPVTATTITLVQNEGSNNRYRVAVTAATMSLSFGTSGTFTDFNGTIFDIQNYVRTDASGYSFEVSNFATPVVGAGTVAWPVLKFAPDTNISSGDIADLGVVYGGYTGHRYRVTKTFTTPPVLSDVGNWAVIDSSGVVSYIENFTYVSGTTYRFEIVSALPPAAGPSFIFYKCEIVTSCDFGRASALLVKISPAAILAYPQALAGDALERLVLRLKQMIPAHVRIAAFILDQGPAMAHWSIAASSTINEGPSPASPYSALYDETAYPADVLPTDTSSIIATTTSNIVNQNVFEEYLVGPDPIVNGTWTATGLWHVTSYRSSTGSMSFLYGQNDIGVRGGVGAVAPDFNTVASTSGTLTSPLIAAIPAATTVRLRVSFYTDVRSGTFNDLTTITVFKYPALTSIASFNKASMGTSGTGNTGGTFVNMTFDITSVVTQGAFKLSFFFDSAGIPPTSTHEGWYVDDVEVQVIP